MGESVRVHVNTRGAARKALSSRAGEVLLAGPAGTGKSVGALFKVHLMSMLNPKMRALMVRKTHKSLTSTGLVTFREKVAVDAIKNKSCWWYGGSGERPAQYIYENGSTIVVGGLDNPDKIMSADYDLIYVQEATDCTLDDWDKLGTRLRNGKVSFQQLLADCNPQAPSHWLKKRCDEGKTLMLHSRHEDNPMLFDELPDGSYVATPQGEAYIARLDALTGVRLQRLRHGLWVAAEGLIYEGWRPDVHLVDALPEGHESWARLWVVDFGFTNPFVWQQWARDPDGRLWLEREIYHTQRLVEDHARQILSVAQGVIPEVLVCDHDAEDRATLERHLGIGTVAAEKTVSDGLQAMGARLRPAGDERPRLYVVRDSLVEKDGSLYGRGLPTCFAEEIEQYVWERPPDGRLDKDRPLKLHDHAMDAGRYLVMYDDLAAKPMVRWL